MLTPPLLIANIIIIQFGNLWTHASAHKEKYRTAYYSFCESADRAGKPEDGGNLPEFFYLCPH